MQHIENWAFDVELLFLASRLGVAVAEESVRWQEIEGSKLDLRAPFDMLRDIVLIRSVWITVSIYCTAGTSTIVATYLPTYLLACLLAWLWTGPIRREWCES